MLTHILMHLLLADDFMILWILLLHFIICLRSNFMNFNIKKNACNFVLEENKKAYEGCPVCLQTTRALAGDQFNPHAVRHF
jgi:hypothetical protein